MDPRVVVFLQHLVRERPASKRLSQSGLAVKQEFGLGIDHQTSLHYSERDFERAAEILQSKGISAELPARSDSRGERAGFGATSEKWRAPSVMDGHVAVRPATAGCRWQGHGLVMPGIAFMAVDTADALAIEAKCLLVVENLECLKRIQRYKWLDLPQATLAVWRGGPLFSEKAVHTLLEQSAMPVWCWLDFDPAGLAIAARLPRLERVLVPNAEAIVELSQARRQGLHDRYLAQLSGSQRTIAECRNDEVLRAWELMKKIGMAIPQEVMIGE